MPNRTEVAKRLVEVVPRVTHAMRRHIRAQERAGMSLLQFRILARIDRGMNTVSALADSFEVSVPAMSKLVESLVQRGLISRSVCKTDRRQTELSITRQGMAAFMKVRRATANHLKDILKPLNDRELVELQNALDSLSRIFSGAPSS